MIELQGRNGSLNMRGEDVKLLQEELRQFCFSIEDRDGFLSRTKRQTVMEFQRIYNLYRCLSVARINLV